MQFQTPDVSESTRPGEVASPATTLPGPVLQRILEHIDANRHRPLRLSELGALARMSVFHFARLFKQSTGVPPHRYVVERRIARAKELLTTDHTSVAEIAQAVGFRTASHFATVFHRATGMTPTAYRSATQEGSDKPIAPVA